MEILKNHLASETSPYLLQHKDNPVAWFPWGELAFATARRLNRPIFLSIGYSSCHWCHVMAHESFEDLATAEVLNSSFISIKIDREEMPDIDSFYMNCLQSMGESGGWPLSMFLTPQLEPFYGGTYFPPVGRYGRPSFTMVLQAISRAYSSEPDKIRLSVESILSTMNRHSPSGEGFILSPEILNDCAERFVKIFDPLLGGISGSPKFPQVSLLSTLWRAYLRTGDRDYRDAVLVTLDRLCRGGIYDHLAGGFCRYSTDERWLVPHFEKMLYDNAQLIEFMSQVWRMNRSPLLESRVAETIDWLMKELWLSGSSDNHSLNPYYGGFASALDADSLDAQGHKSEGAFYVWQASEISTVLGSAAAEFNQLYGVTEDGNWADPHQTPRVSVTVLNQLDLPIHSSRHLPSAPEITASLQRLGEVRNHRPRPERDYKILTDWNGMAISALALASQIFRRPEWLAIAEGNFSFIKEKLAVSDNSQKLHHSYTDQPRHPAMLEDYAQMIRASLNLYQVTAKQDYLAQAETWCKSLASDYLDEVHGGYFMSGADRIDLLQRLKSASDSATPSGNGTMVENLAKLYYLTGHDHYKNKADRIVEIFSSSIPRSPISHAALLNGFESLLRSVQIVILNLGQENIDSWHQAIYDSGISDWVITVLDGKSNPNLPDYVKAIQQGAQLDQSQPLTTVQAFVCFENRCSLPLKSIDDFLSELKLIRNPLVNAG